MCTMYVYPFGMCFVHSKLHQLNGFVQQQIEQTNEAHTRALNEMKGTKKTNENKRQREKEMENKKKTE